ncbi:MAG: ferritin-like domain-containing protein [Polyangiaceae bacterium]
MSDLLRLRRAILVALGLPVGAVAAVACGGSAREPVVRRPDPTEVPPLDAECSEPGFVCSYNERGCGTNATGQLDDVYTGELRGKSWRPSTPETLEAMRFDRERTQKARAQAVEGQEPLNYCCYTGCPKYTEAPPESAVRAQSDIIACVPYPEKTAYPVEAAPKCPATIALDGVQRAFLQFDAEAGTCCYETGRRVENLGRPLRVDGIVTRVSSAEGAPTTHYAGVIDLERYDAAERARLAESWHAAACVEHASVAAFAKISLELLAFGAPVALVAAAHEAALDEIRHAALASEIAARFGAVHVPGAHPAAARAIPHEDLMRFVEETIEDGCVLEAGAALEAWRLASEASDPGIAQAYRAIAADEERHATLAWRIVKWAASVDERVPAVLTRTLARLEARPSLRDTVRDLAKPCAEALIASQVG